MNALQLARGVSRDLQNIGMVFEKTVETRHAYFDLCRVIVFLTFACSSSVSGYEGIFILAGIAQIVVVIRLVVFSLFLLCF